MQILSPLSCIGFGPVLLRRRIQVQTIDESAGRAMPDRTWERGLQQRVQAKEGVEISARNGTLSRISYQRLSRRYLWISGLSGTIREAVGRFGRPIS
jgi:preprotein translocase subunit SecA